MKGSVIQARKSVTRLSSGPVKKDRIKRINIAVKTALIIMLTTLAKISNTIIITVSLIKKRGT